MSAIFLMLLGGLKSAGRWLSSRSLIELACIALALLAGVQTLRVSAEKRHSAKVELQLRKCSEARAADRKAYVDAQAAADAKNKADVAAREARSKRISEETKSAYQTDLAKLRADAERLRRARAQGSAGQSAAPQDGPASQGADGDGLHLSPDQHLQAQEIELRLMHLQNWVSDQLKAQ